MVSNSQVYIATGGIDATIKIWQPDPKGKIIQTLVGHTGTILCIEHVENTDKDINCDDTLITGSSDKTIRIWKQEKGMELLFHPWFTFLQEVSGFSLKKLHEKSVYVTALNCINPD